jgi:hypothetical protein
MYRSPTGELMKTVRADGRTLYTALENPTQCYQNQIATMGSNQYDYGPQTEDCLMLK